MRRFLTTVLFSTALSSSIALTPVVLKAEQPPQRYHDREHNDDHEWNEAEDRAYRRYLEEKRRTYREFRRLKSNEQREYWRWRHEHRDIG
jgi:hypothetical protein